LAKRTKLLNFKFKFKHVFFATQLQASDLRLIKLTLFFRSIANHLADLFIHINNLIIMNNKIVPHSDEVRHVIKENSGFYEYLERLSKTFLGSSTLPQQTPRVDGTVASSPIEHNNLGTEFKNEFKRFDNISNEEKSIHIDKSNAVKLSKNNQLSYRIFTNKTMPLNNDRNINMLLENNRNWAPTKN